MRERLKLRGAFVEADEPKGGLLSLKGTIDRREQAGLIEAEAKRLLEETPAWKADVPGGVSASKLIVFPIRKDVLPKLRRHGESGRTGGQSGLVPADSD